MKNLLFTCFLFIGFVSFGQMSEEMQGLMEDAEQAKQEMIDMNSSVQEDLNKAVAYAIFPNVGKGAFIVGGASGRGIVYENGQPVGMAHMKQADVGFQFGGKAYREIVIFTDDAKYQEFREDDFSLSAQASATILKSGVAAHAKNMNGVRVYIQPKAGLMVDASIGGQRFDFEKMN